MNDIAGQGADIIVHLAAKAGVRPSIEQPLAYADVNINGTVAMLEAARQNRVSKFVFGSSSSVYGNNKKIPFSEDDNVDFPISPYAATKKAGELICHTYHHLYEIAMTCLRFFTVYGPRQRPDLAIHKFARLIEQGKPIPVYGDGSMKRDFTYIDDIINGTMACLDKCEGYHIYNLGESRPLSVSDLIKELEKALGKKATIEYLPLQPGDVEQTYADVTKAVKDLGYNPKTHISDGLKRFVDWLRRENLRA
jgi:UDP-glucuronate 4-epimerase